MSSYDFAYAFGHFVGWLVFHWQWFLLLPVLWFVLCSPIPRARSKR